MVERQRAVDTPTEFVEEKFFGPF
jgi:hypothetical protein